MTISSFAKNTKFAVCTGVVLASFIIYYLTMARGFSYLNFGWDGGDLLSAAGTWGLPHPPGFPLYILISGALIRILPLEPAFITNLLSAVFASLTVGLVFLINFRLTKNLWISLAGALLLAFSRIFWSQALITEVSTLNALFVGLVILLALKFADESRANRRKTFFYSTLLVLGLGAAVHPTILLMLPGLIYLWVGNECILENCDTDVILREPQRPKNLLCRLMGRRSFARLWRTQDDEVKNGSLRLKASLFFFLGLTPYLYIPLRAAVDPFVNWGDLKSLKDFLIYLSASDYHKVISSTGVSEKLFALLQALGLLISNFNLAFVGVVVALYSLILRKDRNLRFLFGLFLTYFVFNVVYFNITAFQAYLLPNLLILTCLATLGFRLILDNSRWELSEKSALFKNRLLYLGLGLAIFAQLFTNFSAVDISCDTSAEDLGRAVFEGLEENAIIVLGLSGDEPNFTLRYYQTVKAKRFDVLLLPPLFSQSERRSAELRRHYPDLNWEGITLTNTEAAAEEQVVQFIENNKADFPIYLFHEEPYREGKYVAWQGYNFYTTSKPIYKLVF